MIAEIRCLYRQKQKSIEELKLSGLDEELIVAANSQKRSGMQIEGSPRKKRLTKAEKDAILKNEIKYIQDYRSKILETVNPQIENERKSVKMDEENVKQTKITFNEVKEVLEFKKNVKRVSAEAQQEVVQKPYQIKSVLKGSEGVYTGTTKMKNTSVFREGFQVYSISQDIATLKGLDSKKASPKSTK